MSSNMNNINYNDFRNICRMCMFNCDVKFYQNCVVSNIFHKLTDLHFETNDRLPQQICQKCFEKTNEIHEFALHCKRTHSALMECLSKQEVVEQNERIKEGYKFRIVLDKNVTADEHTSIFVENNSSNPADNKQMKIKQEIMEETNDNIIQETRKIKEEVIENTDLQETNYHVEEQMSIEELKIEYVRDETSEVNNDQSINCFEDPLLIPNTSNIKVEKEDQSENNAILNDFNHGLNSEQSLVSKRSYKCEQCSKSFTRSHDLKTHYRSHTGERPYQCKLCTKAYIYSGDLKSHMLTHTGERPYKCELCSQAFTQSCNLKTHMRTHTGERPFECEHCSKSFKLSCNLKKHIRTHTGERPFECQECLKAFVRSDDLKSHMLTHTGERPFKCDQCSKTYIYSCDLRTHIRTHTGERPFECQECSKSFVRSNDLKKHLRTHTGDRPFKCELCPKSFTVSCNLKTHMNNAHPCPSFLNAQID